MIADKQELLLLDAANHIKMARAQRSLYQQKVAAAGKDATEGVTHLEQTYTLSWIMGKIWNCQFTIRSNQGVLIILAL